MSIVAFQDCCKSPSGFWICASSGKLMFEHRPQVWVDLHWWWTQLRCGHPWFEEFRSPGESEEQCPAFRRHISRWCSSSMGRNAWHGLCWRVFSLAHHFDSFHWQCENCFRLMAATHRQNHISDLKFCCCGSLKSRFQSYNGEISVGSYGFTLGKYTEQAAELLDTKDWVVKIQEKERVAAFAGEINKSLEKVQHPYRRLCLLWLGWTGQTFAQANVDKQDLQPSAPQSQLWVRNFIMRLFDSPFFTHLYPKSW